MSPSRPSYIRRIRYFVFLLLFAMPVAGGLLSFIQVFRDGFGADGLAGVIDIAVSGDGAHVYAVGSHSNSLAAFGRNETTGTLDFLEFFEDGEDGVFGLVGASGVAVSPDGRHVFATAEADDTLLVFSRTATTDELTFIAAAVQEDMVGAFGLDGASSVAASPDDEQVFVTARIDDAVAVFNRNATTDDLTFVEAEFDGFGGVDGLAGAAAVAVSPDNLHVYVAADVDDAVTVFSRDLLTGTISFASKAADGVGGVDGLNGASGVAVAPDGRNVYVTGRVDDAVAAFDRDDATGALTFLAAYRDGVAGVDGLAGAMDVELNPSGTRVLVAGRDDDAVAVFRRDADGTLQFLEAVRDGTGAADGLAGVYALAVLDTHVYAAAHDEDAVSGFDLAVCDGNEASGDVDGDAICDNADLCLGDDFEGDDDTDGICNDLDACPGFDDAIDDDLDGVPDGCELCTGDDATGDDDGDGVCDDTDICPGASDAFDGDGDGVPDGCDVCLGDDAAGDGDSDGVCDDLDVCAGFDDGDDGDEDGVPDGCDVCLGHDDGEDADEDGVPDGCDVCLGDDAAGDGDGDGLCADLDCDDADAGNACAVFADGFESGDTTAWSQTMGL